MGNINSDAIDNLIIGAPAAYGEDAYFVGKSYVVFGSDQGFTAIFDLSELDGTMALSSTGPMRRMKAASRSQERGTLTAMVSTT